MNRGALGVVAEGAEPAPVAPVAPPAIVVGAAEATGTNPEDEGLPCPKIVVDGRALPTAAALEGTDCEGFTMTVSSDPEEPEPEPDPEEPADPEEPVDPDEPEDPEPEDPEPLLDPPAGGTAGLLGWPAG